MDYEGAFSRLRDVLGVLDSDVVEKSATIDKFEIKIRRRNDEIAKKAREVDRLNKQLAKMSEDAAADDSNSKGYSSCIEFHYDTFTLLA